MFKIVDEPLPGWKVLAPRSFSDLRGSFTKTFHADLWKEMGIDFSPKEEFFTVSRQNVLRGMHLQVPPAAHLKVVYCLSGAVLDVVVDVRRSSPNFGKAATIKLSAENRYIAVIPIGFAHGFLSLQDNSCTVYKTDHVYAPAYDTGFRWDSFDFQWPINQDTIISERDRALPPLAEFSAF